MGSINEGIANLTVAGRAGFYRLGKIPVCGSIKSFCALGRVQPQCVKPGQVSIFIFNINNQNRMREMQINNLDVCNNDVDIPVKTSDFITVYIPSMCPLQVDFESEDGNGAQYYQNSDRINVSDFQASELSELKLNQSMVWLNVNVTIMEYTDAQLGNVIVDQLLFTGTETRTGLYVLGDVPDSCVYRQFCAFGRINTETYHVSTGDKNVTGWLTFFVVRFSVQNNFVVRESLNLTQDNSSTTEACIDSNITVLRGDFIVMAIPNSCTESSTSVILCPLQVNFEKIGNTISYYNNSTSVLNDYYGSNNDATIITDILSSENVAITNEFLNARVITEGMYHAPHYILHSDFNFLH